MAAFPWGDEPACDYYKRKCVRHESEVFQSPRGVPLFVQSWAPDSGEPVRANIFMVHGYGSDSSWTFQSTAILFAQRLRCAAFALDLQGHGRSAGLRGFVPSVPDLAQDCLAFFSAIRSSSSSGSLSEAIKQQQEQEEDQPRVPCFLYGESLGAAICILVHFLQPSLAEGAILVAPMCRISSKMRPSWPMAALLGALASVAPRWAVVPVQDLAERSMADARKREVGRRNPRRYAGRPRLGTVAELLRVTEHIQARLAEVQLPFLLLHGDADVVTEPEASRALYEQAGSHDKTLRIYRGMQHSLLQGEPDENVEIVVADIAAWLDDRTATKVAARPLSP